MESNPHKFLIIFGLKREYDTFSPIKNFKKTYGFAKKALISLKGVNLSEIDTTEIKVPTHFPNKTPETSSRGDPNPNKDIQTKQNKKNIRRLI